MGPQRCGEGLDKFLLKELEQGEVQGLIWRNRAQGIFQVPWKHASTKNFYIPKDRSLAIRYEVFRGKQPWLYTYDELKGMQQGFAAVLKKSKTIKCIKKKVAPANSGQAQFRIYGFIPCDIGVENNTETVVDVGMPGEYDEFIQGLILSMSPENNEGLFVNAQEVGEVVDTEQSMEERSVNGVNDIKITQDTWAAFMDAASQAVSCSQVDAGCTADVNDALTADVGAHDPQIMQSAPCAKQMLHEDFLPMEQIHAPCAEQMLHENVLPMEQIHAPCAEQMRLEQFLSMEQIHAPCAEQMLHENVLPMEQIHAPCAEQMRLEQFLSMEQIHAYFAEQMLHEHFLPMEQIHAPCAEQMLHEQFLPMEQIHATLYEAAPLEPGSLGFPEVIPPGFTDQVPEPMLPPSPFMEYVKMDFGSYATTSPLEECLLGLNDN